MNTLSVDTFIRDVASGIGDAEADKFYTRLLRITLRDVEGLNLHVIPNFKSVKLTVGDNLTADLPDDCIEPIRSAKFFSINGRPYCYPLGKKDDLCELIDPPENFSCPQDCATDETTSNTCLSYQNISGYSNLNLWYYGWYYGEYYGYHESKVFGYWGYEDQNNRIVFESGGCVGVGDVVVVKYKSEGRDDRGLLIPMDIYPMLRNRVLQHFYETSNPSKGRYFLQEFRRELAMYKRSKLNKYSYIDYLNAYTIGHTSAPK